MNEQKKEVAAQWWAECNNGALCLRFGQLRALYIPPF
jgi:hypothetical protein